MAASVAASIAIESQLAPKLLAWWQRHGRRDLPWQQNPTPYRVWVSEIMLQQTQVTTVERYYDRFMAAFPDVAALAGAEIDQVLHLWSGLGYYARARNLHRAAGIVRDHHGGELPTMLDSLVELPGIGRSTAGAILALSGNQRHPILDGNARRVLARLFGIEGWPGTTAITARLWQHADACTPADQPGRYTQAIMDLGATVCVRSQPGCQACPVLSLCIAHRTGRVAAIPGPRPRRERGLRRTFALIVVREDGAALLEQRPAEGIWGGLWGFPEADSEQAASDWCRRELGVDMATPKRLPLVQHAFTHFDLELTPLRIDITAPASRVMEHSRQLWYKFDSPAEIGLAAPVSRLLQDIGESS